MGDYAKLVGPLHLEDWEVALSRHPDYPPFQPFAAWSTGPLHWYQEHHGVKHDREALFPRATLENVLSALGAAYVLVCAQFGRFGEITEIDELRVTTTPTWPLAEYYVPPQGGVAMPWQAVNHPALA
jgi:hypothetical protein